MAKKQIKNEAVKEPSVVIKPLGRMGGLDTIHVSLIVLVVIMAGLLLAVTWNSTVQPVTLQQNCTYQAQNGTCITPLHNSSQVRMAVEKFIAGYAYNNTSESLFPYTTAVNSMSITFIPVSREWYVTVPTQDLYSNTTFSLEFIFNDVNSTITPFTQAVSPNISTDNYVQSYGVVSLYGKAACSVSTPAQVYWFIDPYSPGSIHSLVTLSSLETSSNDIQAHIEVLYTQYSAQIAKSYGINNTQAFGKYVFCASQQSNFTSFADTLNSVYNGQYMSPSLLATLAKNSGLNSSALQICIANSSEIISRQSVIAKYYNVTSTPIAVTNCEYQSIPQTEQYALCLTNSTLCK